jgi:hypothetical protein
MSLTPAIYSVEETGTILHLSIIAVRNLIKSGQLGASFVGRSYIVTQASIDAYLESRSTIRKEKNTNPIHLRKLKAA